MAQRVVLHAGLMKSGTSYVQQRLAANRELLAERGVLFPGASWRAQVLAVGDVLGRRRGGAAGSGRWAELVGSVAGFGGTAVISMEFLGPAPPQRIAEVVGSFGAADVRVVLTLRDLGRGVPAMWQESLQNGSSLPWRQYVDLLESRRRPARAFWRQQGMARIVGNWVEAVGAGHVCLVTVPPAGAVPTLLWDRFCAAAEIPGAGCVDVAPANPSLDAASAMVLRDLNERLAEDELPVSDYHTLVKFGVAKQVVAGRVGGVPIGFEPPPWLVERSAAMVAGLAAAGTRVVGDLAELAPVTVPGVDPDDVGEAERLAAAVHMLHGLTVQRAAARQRLRRRTSSPGPARGC